MGQYYKFIILANEKKNNKEVILLVLHPHNFGEGSKIMEHSYINNMMNTVEYLLSVNSNFHKSRIVWAGDYADEEYNNSNLYTLAEEYSHYNNIYEDVNLQYIVNHTKKLYVDKKKIIDEIHPLPLLVSEGNGRGGGDYYGNNKKLCGTWARDIISMEYNIPENYTELECNFYE